MVYLANISPNENLALEIYNQLTEMKIETYRPNENIQFQGREINVNAFDQLRKRNPNNPYIIELKKTIMEILNKNIKNNDIFLLINKRSEQFIKETIFEMSIAWTLKKTMLSLEDITPINGELVIAMDIKSLQGDITRIKKYLITEKEVDQIKEEVKRLVGKGKQKLTIQL